MRNVYAGLIKQFYFIFRPLCESINNTDRISSMFYVQEKKKDFSFNTRSYQKSGETKSLNYFYFYISCTATDFMWARTIVIEFTRNEVFFNIFFNFIIN